MLKDEIELRERARRLNIGVEHVVRDVLQARLIGAVFSASAGELVLKGGLAMRTSHRSQRYTKDVDLQTGPQVPQARVTGIIRKALKQAAETGFLKQVSITEPKQTDTVQRWKVAGVVGSSHINMTVEVSRRGLPPPEDLVTTQVVDLAGQARPVYSYSASAIAASKVVALVAPNRVAARDLYDLDLLITMEVNPPIARLTGRWPPTGRQAIICSRGNGFRWTSDNRQLSAKRSLRSTETARQATESTIGTALHGRRPIRERPSAMRIRQEPLLSPRSREAKPDSILLPGRSSLSSTSLRSIKTKSE